VRLRLARKEMKAVSEQERQAEQFGRELEEMSQDASTVQVAMARLEQREKAMSGDGGSAARRDALRHMNRLAVQMGVQASIGGGMGRTLDEERTEDSARIARARRLQTLLDPRTVEEKAEAGALRTKIAAREEERFEVQLALRMRRSEQQRLQDQTRGRAMAARQQVRALESACKQLEK